MSTRVRAVLLISCLLALAPAACRETGGGQADQAPCLEAVPVRRGDIAQKVTARGAVKPASLVQVKPPVEGTVIEVLVRVGDRVRKGQVVARVAVDSRYQSYISESRITLVNARLRRQTLEKQIERSRQLLKEGLVSQTGVEEMESSLEEVRMREKVAAERVREIEGKLGRRIDADDSPPPSDYEIQAPAAGTVMEVMAQPGEAVNPNLSGGGLLRERSLLALADLDDQVLAAAVSELDINRLAVGQPVEVVFDSLPGRVLAGKVGRIASFASASPASFPERAGEVAGRKRFDVEITLGPGGPSLRTGLSFKASFLVQEKKGVLLIPISAVTGEGGKDLVLARQGKEQGEGFRQVAVSTGMADEDQVEITSGLSEGDLVCARPAPSAPPPPP